jgi:hypothetical protein
MDAETKNERARAVLAVLHEAAAELHQPSWTFLARAGLLTGGEAPTWGSVRMEDRNVVEAVVFTVSRVTHAVRKVDSDECTVRVFPRRDLQEVAIDNGDPEAWHGDWGTAWPGGVQVAATYRDGTTLRLPLIAQPMGRATRQRFDEFLDDLTADLSPRS